MSVDKMSTKTFKKADTYKENNHNNQQRKIDGFFESLALKTNTTNINTNRTKATHSI